MEERYDAFPFFFLSFSLFFFFYTGGGCGHMQSIGFDWIFLFRS